MPKPPSPYQRFRAKWIDCRACELCTVRKNVVLLGGSVPATVLFIGEAPGESEDCCGEPFIGPAGHLLRSLIARAGMKSKDFAMTNLIACIPKEEIPIGLFSDDTKEMKLATPPEYAIEACRERLNEAIALVKPKLIVRVGAEADQHVGEYDTPQLSIVHPAHILRLHITQQGLAQQRCVVAMSDAWEELQAAL